MRDNKGQFIKGARSSPATEFKSGQHWREKKPFWDKEWLENEYVTKRRSSGDLAAQFDITEAAIIFWLKKHHIPRRSISEARAVKHWGSAGEQNPMYGRVGILNPNWQGGITPFRQDIYAKSAWKKAAPAVWARDKNCRLCGGENDLEIHHIDPVSQSPLLIMDIGNMILLCFSCHVKTRRKEKRWRKKLLHLLQESN